MKLNKLAQTISLICIAGTAFAQSAPSDPPKPAPKTEKIEVTGSSIKRVQEEGATPLTIITRADIDRAGIVSAEQLVSQIMANGNGADNLASNMGVVNTGVTDRNNNGNSSANLRGLGAGNTLVLLNGRRVAVHGAKGAAVDLNTIPLAAIERVEVLRDGASAIYGTDAVGGVINFIMRKDFNGVQLSSLADVTQHGGGNIFRGSIVAGKGDIAKDRYNVLANVTFDKAERLRAVDRSFVNGIQPGRGLSPDTTGTPFATQTGGAGTAIGATFRLPSTGTQTYNRANLLSFQGRCNAGDRMDQYAAALWGNPGFAFGCTWDNVGNQSLQSPVDRINAVGRATIELSPNHTAIFEAVGSRTETERVFEHSQITTSIGAGNAYPANGPYYQNLSAFIPTFNASLPIAYRWRCYDCGPRTTNSTAWSWRYMAALEGTVGKFDYKLGISTAGNKSYTVLGDGYMKTNEFNAVLASGIVNPWLLPGQSQTAAALAAINSAKAAGTNLFGGEASLSQADGLISGEIFTLPWGGTVAAAAGFDVRKESYLFRNGAPSTVPVRDAPFDAEFPKVSRDIKAVFTEVAIPLLKNLEATAAVRRDTYQVIGSTTNPKYSIKFTPSDQLLIRGSYSEGFKAPNFFQLYSATGESPVPGNVRDPILCPVGGTVTDLSVCAIRPNARAGGNPDLKPETSKQWTVGFVLAPVEWASIAIDTYQIRRKGVVYELNGQQVIANYLTFPNNLVRGTDGRLDGPGGYIRAGYVNADGDILRGWDVSLKAQGRMLEGKWEASMEGTYTSMYDSRIFVTQPYLSGVGVSTTSDGTAVRNLFLRWKHIAKFTYTQGPWSATLTQNYSNGYKDEKPLGVVPPGWDSNVKAYVTHNVSVGYTGFKNTTLRFGIKNIADIKPPFTAHNVDFSPGAGWDPRVADPRLRSFTFSAQYKF